MLVSLYEEAILEPHADLWLAIIASALAIYVFVGSLLEIAELRDQLAWIEREILRCHLMYEND